MKLGVFPWLITPESLESARPTRREWGSAWVLLSEADETLDLPAFVELVCGAAGPQQSAACWLALHQPQWMYRFRLGTVQARSADDLKRLRQDQWRQVLESERRQLLQGWLQQDAATPLEALDSHVRHWVEQIQDFAAGAIDLRDLDDGCRCVLKDLKLDLDPHELHRTLVSNGAADPHQLPAMQGSRWSSGFNAEQLLDAETLLTASESSQPGDESRLDLCHLHCVTIDDQETRDIDDALSLERKPDGSERIWIHIADPGRLIQPGSSLDQEAAARGSSLYLARGNQPMFPEALSTGPFSLRAGHKNAAWSTWVELNDDGAIAAYGITRSWVKPLYKLSYEDADELIDLAPPEEADLADLDQLLQRRKQWRERNGALLMDLPEGRIRCRDGEPSLEITEPSPSRLMVAEAMILTGAVTAQYGVDHGLALPYRSQLPAELPSPAQLSELPDGAVRFAAIKRCLSRGLMGTKPAAHFSLGLPAYVQATSPIRRYCDLIVQRQIQAHQAGSPGLNEEELQELVGKVDLATREGIGISREDQRHWQQVWFEQHRNEQWQADFLRWLRPQDRLGLIRIEALALDLAAECPPGSEPGDHLQVQVQDVDPIRDQLRLQAH